MWGESRGSFQLMARRFALEARLRGKVPDWTLAHSDFDDLQAIDRKLNADEAAREHVEGREQHA